jgi:hypothetical protein
VAQDGKWGDEIGMGIVVDKWVLSRAKDTAKETAS